MEVNARIDKALRHLRIIKRGSWDTAMTLTDAKAAWDAGKITKHNKVFARLVDNDFDVKKTLQWFRGERDRLAEEKSNG